MMAAPMLTATTPRARARAEVPSIRAKLAYLACLLVIIAVGYGGVATAYFVADDFNALSVVAAAENLHQGTGIAAGWVFFRPLTAIAFWLTYLVCGMSPLGFHLFGFLFHWLTAWLVACLSWQLFPQRLGAAFAGACFAALPLHPEAITWISVRSDVLCAASTLLCLSGWLGFLLQGGGAGALFKTGAGFVLALLTKDTAMILPLLLLLLAMLAPARQAKPRFLALAGVFLVFAVYMAARLFVLGGFGGAPGPDGTRYLQVNLPRAIGFTWDSALSMLMPGGRNALSIICLLLLVYLLVRHLDLLRTGRLGVMLLVCFVVHLAPAANTVVLDLDTGMNSRFLYIPSTFFCVGLGVVLGRGFQSRRSVAMVVAAGLLICGHTLALRQANQKWRVAGDQAQAIVQQLKGIAAGKGYSHVFIHGLPDNHEGAYVFRNGIETAITIFTEINLFEGEKLKSPLPVKISLADWDKFSAARRADPTASPEVLLLRWDPEARRMVEP